MRGKNAAVAVHEGEAGAVDLALVGLAAQLVHGLDGVEHAAGRARVAIREQAAVGVAWQRAAQAELALHGRRAGLAALEETDSSSSTSSVMVNES